MNLANATTDPDSSIFSLGIIFLLTAAAVSRAGGVTTLRLSRSLLLRMVLERKKREPEEEWEEEMGMVSQKRVGVKMGG